MIHSLDNSENSSYIDYRDDHFSKGKYKNESKLKYKATYIR